ncbi:hypothetical protein K438DRAFT_415460 [Mycena galopus ATCC 62051]|nr:hypothetical protein K438DRAFT_415460 [Mycena galopus ATCC 62051]
MYSRTCTSSVGVRAIYVFGLLLTLSVRNGGHRAPRSVVRRRGLAARGSGKQGGRRQRGARGNSSEVVWYAKAEALLPLQRRRCTLPSRARRAEVDESPMSLSLGAGRGRDGDAAPNRMKRLG